MSNNFKPLPASSKPWMIDEKPFHSTFYPLHWGKQNSYAIFSPGIDRFLIVDNYDPWVLHETARVLSPKISTITYVLDQPTPHMTNENCLEFSTKHKIEEKQYGGPTIMSHRQSGHMMKIRPNMVREEGWPIDFETPVRKAALLRLQEYTRFSLRVMHSLTIGSMFRNPFPEKYYMDTFFENEYPEEFKVRVDCTNAPEGMEKIIKNILYVSDTLDQALEEIHNAWRTHSWNDISGFRQAFYFSMGLTQPDDLEALGTTGEFDKDRNDQTMWVV
jgi:hypothetical protein